MFYIKGAAGTCKKECMMNAKPNNSTYDLHGKIPNLDVENITHQAFIQLYHHSESEVPSQLCSAS